MHSLNLANALSILECLHLTRHDMSAEMQQFRYISFSSSLLQIRLGRLPLICCCLGFFLSKSCSSDQKIVCSKPINNLITSLSLN